MAPRRGCTWGVLEGGLGWDLQGLRAGIPTWAEGAWSVVFSHLLQPGQLLRELGDASVLLVGVLQALDSPTTARLKKQNWKLTEIDKNKKILWIWGALKKISKTITGGALYYLCLTWLGSKACLGAPEPLASSCWNVPYVWEILRNNREMRALPWKPLERQRVWLFSKQKMIPENQNCECYDKVTPRVPCEQISTCDWNVLTVI